MPVDVRTALDQVERAEKLDVISNPVNNAVQNLLPDRVRDFLNGVWLGHPLHPVLMILRVRVVDGQVEVALP